MEVIIINLFLKSVLSAVSIFSLFVCPADNMHKSSSNNYIENDDLITKRNSEDEENEVNLQALLSQVSEMAKMKINYDILYANAEKTLELNNYLGNNQNVHPKVLYIEDGFGGHSYWMAYTPYPESRDAYENPCVAYSDDGYSWENIESCPLDDPHGYGYNSDAHLLYREDTSTLECWYRYVGDQSQPIREETIYRQISEDGIHWSEKELVYSNMSGSYAQLLSPSIIWDGEKYHIWVVEYTTSAIVHYVTDPSNISNWTRMDAVPIPFNDDGIDVNPWHIDVLKDNNKYIFLVMCRKDKKLENPMSLFITSTEDNITYESPYKVLQGSSGWDRYIYRSSIVKVNGEYRIYYSATIGGRQDVYTGGAVWGIGVTNSRTLDRFISKK